jgi:two-component system cell cycle sensor histidine kinase/response regulator CckA
MVAHSTWSSDLEALAAYFPDSSGTLLYLRSATPPWELRAVIGDCLGVLGVPGATVRAVWSELVHSEDEPKLIEALARIGSSSSTLDYRIRTSSGGERWVRDSMQRVSDRGAGGSIVGIIRDVSLERTLRSQVQALEERIWKAQRVDSLGGLAAGIAHDLGNLLTATLSAVQLVESRGDLPASALDDLAVARESARRGSDFVRQILRFAARDDVRPGPCDINSLLDDLRIILGRSLGSDIQLMLVQEPGLPKIHCDPVQMEQVLLNLTVNARDAMPGGGQLRISTELTRINVEVPAQGTTVRPGQYVVLSVTDTGKGIPEQVRQRIFEPFFSTKTSTGTGTGFGLSTVQRIVQSHRGGVRVESTEGRGTTFRIYLPVRESAERLEVAGPNEETETRGRVLVVEADPAVREVMKRVLALEGFAVLAVEGARDALRRFDRVRPPFDLLITDLALPDRSGSELVRLLRKRVERLAAVYLVGYSAHSVHLLPDEPGTSHLEKPFTPSQLIEAVERARGWLAEGTAASPSGIRHARL